MGYKGILQQYIDLRIEIKDLERKIEKLEAKIESDIVEGSSSHFPYEKKRFHIEGVPYRKTRLKKILNKRKLKCEIMKIEIEEFINTIPDSKTRRVFQYRYIDDLAWQAIAMRLGRVHESYPRRDIHDKYLESL